MWKAPEAMNRMWSVLTMPYLVVTVLPSTSGSRSRCTPSRDTSAPMVSWRRATLSISSMNTMPFCSALAQRPGLELLLVDQLAGLFVDQQLQRFADLELARARARAAQVLEHRLQLLRHFLHAGRRHDFHADGHCAHLDLDLALVELALAQHLAEFLPRLGIARRCRLVGREAHAVAGAAAGYRARAPRRRPRARSRTLLDFLLARHLHRDIHQVLHDASRRRGRRSRLR